MKRRERVERKMRYVEPEDAELGIDNLMIERFRDDNRLHLIPSSFSILLR